MIKNGSKFRTWICQHQWPRQAHGFTMSIKNWTSFPVSLLSKPQRSTLVKGQIWKVSYLSSTMILNIIKILTYIALLKWIVFIQTFDGIKSLSSHILASLHTCAPGYQLPICLQHPEQIIKSNSEEFENQIMYHSIWYLCISNSCRNANGVWRIKHWSSC